MPAQFARNRSELPDREQICVRSHGHDRVGRRLDLIELRLEAKHGRVAGAVGPLARSRSRSRRWSTRSPRCACCSTGSPWQRAWREPHVAAFRRMLAGRPVVRALLPASFHPRWTADFLTVAPASPEPTFAAEWRPSGGCPTSGSGPTCAPPARSARRRAAGGRSRRAGGGAPRLGLDAHRRAGVAGAGTPAPGGHRGPHRRVERGRLGRGVRRPQPQHALAGRRPAPGQRLPGAAAVAGRGRAAGLPPGALPSRLGGLGQADPVRDGVSGARDPGRSHLTGTRRARPADRREPGPHPGQAGHAAEHLATRGGDRALPRDGERPPAGAAGRGRRRQAAVRARGALLAYAARRRAHRGG